MSEICSQHEHDVGNAKIRLRPDLATSLSRTGGRPFVLIEDTLTSNFYRLGLDEWRIARLFDGKRTIRQIAVADRHEHSDVLKIARWLLQIGLADRVEGSVAAPATRPNPMGAWASLAGRNLLFIKVSFPNPELLLRKVYPWAVWFFSPVWFIPWLITCCTGVGSIITQWTRFHASVQDVFSPSNWICLLFIWIMLKVVHELAHATVCIRYGGRVTRCGVMFILFSPVAWVDVTSAWNFRSKWARIAVSGAGMYVECFLAALAAVVWAWTADQWVDLMCRNIVLTAGISTLLFNLNFLMRFDGYYMLADWLDVQNLYQAGQQYVQYFGRRYLLNLSSARPRVEAKRVKFVVLYGFAAQLWKLVFYFGVLIVATHLFHGAGILLAVCSGLVWFALPALRFGHFLWKGRGREQPDRTRFAVVGLTALILGGISLTLPWPSARRAHGIVDFGELHAVRADSSGFIQRVCVEAGQVVEAGQLLIEIDNPELRSELADIDLQVQRQTIKQRVLFRNDEIALYLAANKKLDSLVEQRQQLCQRVENLGVRAPMQGEVFGAGLASLHGSHVREGQVLLSVGSQGQKTVRILVNQDDADTFRSHVDEQVHLAIHGRFDDDWSAQLRRVHPKATRQVLHPSLSATCGGPLAATKKSGGTDTVELAEPYFEGIVDLTNESSQSLRSGERCIVSLGRGQQSVGHKLWSVLQQFVARKSGQT